jgi:hypothetical protein
VHRWIARRGGLLHDEDGWGDRGPDRRPQFDIDALARTDDQSVVRGLLEVEVRPWDVRFTG